MTYNREYSDYERYAQAHQARTDKIRKDGLTVKGVEIFRAGEHKPMNGQTFLFSNAMLNDVVASYNMDKHHAPVVVGHPKTDAPAYGWVSDLRVEGDRLVADFTDIDPQFADLVKAKRYRKISSSFYKPDAPNSPSPGKWSLKHVGFLGAAAPAVSGLKEANFSSHESGIVAFGEDDIHGLPAEYVNQIQAHENGVAIDRMVSEGRILAVHRDQVLDFANALDNSEAMSFSDGEEHGKRDWFLNFLSELPQVVSYGSYDMSASHLPDHHPANAPHGFALDPDGLALQAKANALAKAENISFEEAVKRVTK